MTDQLDEPRQRSSADQTASGNGSSAVAVLMGPLRAFLRAEAAGGVLLFITAVVALAWANSPAAGAYTDLWSSYLTIGPVSADLRHWVNDALMVIFFFVVGLEIKRELAVGELRSPRAAALPVIAAGGGVLVPALLFLLIVGNGVERAGWGIPIATDIAFAVGVLALLRNRVSAGTRLFLLSVAIVDDIIAICVIAIFYTRTVEMAWLGVAVAGLAMVVVLRRFGVSAIWPYLLVGAGVWFATFQSGIHATIAGVALGLLTPAGPVRGRKVLEDLEHRLHPVSAFLVIPVFALANAGVALGGGALADAARSPVTIGVVAGLLLGKAVGISVATLVALRLRVGTLPAGMATGQVWGVAALAGIGFTVSLFIADLSYQDSGLVDQAKIGILVGSVASGLLGAALLLRRALPAGHSPPG